MDNHLIDSSIKIIAEKKTVYGILKKILKEEIVGKEIEIDEYFNLAVLTASYIFVFEMAGTSIFDGYYHAIHPKKNGDPESFKQTCADLLNKIENLYRLRKESLETKIAVNAR